MSKDKATATNYDGLWGRQIKAETERKQRMKGPTPRPWTWLPKEGQFIVDKDRNIVAEVPCTSGNPADGAFIVTAVNERDQLLAEVAQLREALERNASRLEQSITVGDLLSDQVYVMRLIRDMAHEARAALSGDKE